MLSSKHISNENTVTIRQSDNARKDLASEMEKLSQKYLSLETLFRELKRAQEEIAENMFQQFHKQEKKTKFLESTFSDNYKHMATRIKDKFGVVCSDIRDLKAELKQIKDGFVLKSISNNRVNIRES